MHVFCAACYSGWMERSSLCPTCRCPVERIRKNHILNNLVEAYLIQHPGLHTFKTTDCLSCVNSMQSLKTLCDPACLPVCPYHREVSQRGGPEEHGQPEQDHAGHAAAKSGALFLWRGWQLGLSLRALRQRQRLLRHQVKDFLVFECVCVCSLWQREVGWSKNDENASFCFCELENWRTISTNDLVYYLCSQSASGDVQTVSRLQGGGQSAAFRHRFKLLARSAGTPRCTSPRVFKSLRGAAINLLR